MIWTAVLAILVEEAAATIWVVVGDNRDGGLERMSMVDLYGLLVVDGSAVDESTVDGSVVERRMLYTAGTIA